MGRRLSLLVSLLTAAMSLAAASSGATTFVMVADEALADQAALVVEARLLGRSPAGGAAVATEYHFVVERVIKGTPSESLIAVRVPGGIRADGMGLKVWGAPVFREDQRALLFLAPRADGSFGVLHLALGAFHVVDVEGEAAAVRDLSHMQEVRVAPGGVAVEPAGADRPRDLERFARWLEDRVAGRRRAADYFVDLPESALRQATAPFTLLDCDGPPCTGLNMRWFEFDSGGSVSWRAHADGLAGIAGGGFAQFQTGLNAWNADAATPISYTYGGTTTANLGFSDFDDLNVITFRDFQSDILDGDFDCESGGVIAIGGPWFDEDARGVFKGITYLPIAGGDIIINDGTQCFFQDSPKVAEEVFAHELGHTLGLGHSCSTTSQCNANPTLNDALMRWNAHDDGRGASLRSDDRAGIAKLYQPATPAAPAAPSNLVATAVSTIEVLLDWQDNSNNETEFEIELQTALGTFTQLVAPAPPAIVTGLTPGTIYSFRVRARNNAGSSAYSNIASATTFSAPGPCVAGPTTLCLSNDRFRVEALWQTATASGAAQAVELTSDTGYLWFFSATNVEVVIKVLNACAIPGAPRYWVFAGGLTNVRTIIAVTDTQNGSTRTYENPQGTPFQPIQDTGAFATCP